MSSAPASSNVIVTPAMNRAALKFASIAALAGGMLGAVAIDRYAQSAQETQHQQNVTGQRQFVKTILQGAEPQADVQAVTDSVRMLDNLRRFNSNTPLTACANNNWRPRYHQEGGQLINGSTYSMQGLRDCLSHVPPPTRTATSLGEKAATYAWGATAGGTAGGMLALTAFGMAWSLRRPRIAAGQPQL